MAEVRSWFVQVCLSHFLDLELRALMHAFGPTQFCPASRAGPWTRSFLWLFIPRFLAKSEVSPDLLFLCRKVGFIFIFLLISIKTLIVVIIVFFLLRQLIFEACIKCLGLYRLFLLLLLLRLGIKIYLLIFLSIFDCLVYWWRTRRQLAFCGLFSSLLDLSFSFNQFLYSLILSLEHSLAS